jgi:acyl carrier protein
MAANVGKGRTPSSQRLASARGITSEEGVNAFARILSSSFSQVAVVTTDFATAIHDYESSLDRHCQKTSVQADAALSDGLPNGALSRPIPSDEVERRIADIWQKLLGTKQLGIYDNFFELGGDSLLGTQLLSSLRSVFHVQLPLQSLLEVPTVAGMAARIRALQ